MRPRTAAPLATMLFAAGMPGPTARQDDFVTIVKIELAVIEHLERQSDIHDTGLVAIDPRYFLADSFRVSFDGSATRTKAHLGSLAKPGRRIVARRDSLIHVGANSFVGLARFSVVGERVMRWEERLGYSRGGVV